MSCHGFPAELYDQYVLGLVDDDERKMLEKHVEERCPNCIRGIQRSMNLWFVFANTLEDAQPSAGFRARLTKIAELGKTALKFPESAPIARHTRMFRFSYLIFAVAVLAVLIVSAWIGGQLSSGMQAQRLSAALNALTNQMSTTQVKLQEQRAQIKELERSLQLAGHAGAAAKQAQIRRRLVELEAEANQYKSAIDRQQQLFNDNKQLINLFSLPGVRLFPMKSTQAAKGCIAYAVLVEPIKLSIVANNLPKLAAGRAFQLWLIRDQNQAPASAGVFTADENGYALYEFADSSLLPGTSRIKISDEPRNGSPSPTGSVLLETDLITSP